MSTYFCIFVFFWFISFVFSRFWTAIGEEWSSFWLGLGVFGVVGFGVGILRRGVEGRFGDLMPWT